MQKVKQRRVATIVILIMIVAAAMLISFSGTAQANTDSAKYLQPVFERESEYGEQFDSNVGHWDSESDNISFDDIRYVIEFSADSTISPWPESCFSVLFNYSSSFPGVGDHDSVELLLGTKADTSGGGYGVIKAVEILWAYGPESGSLFLYESPLLSNGATIFDKMFLTLTWDKVILSTCDPYGSYSDSLSNILFTLDKDANADEYKLFFNVLVGSFTNNRFDCVNGSVKESLVGYKEMEAPVKEGYTFTGWYYDEACTRPYKGEPITSDVNLYAGFKINSYNVTFDCGILDDPSDPNNVGFYNKTEQYNYGDIIDYVPEPVAGSEFYWVFEDGTRYNNTPVESDMTLYLRSMLTLTFELPGVDEVIEPMTVEYGAIVNLPIPASAPDRHAFGGWDCPDIPSWNEEIPVTSDMNLVAIFFQNVFTVTFYVDNEIFKQIDVALGSTLGGVSKDLGVDTATVVGYGYCNISTSSIDYDEMEVIDDVVVYLSESFDIDDNTPGELDENATGIKDKFEKFGNDVKAFFIRVGHFFQRHWKSVVACIGVVMIVVIAIMVIVKIRR